MPKWRAITPPPPCACGCGEPVTGRHFRKWLRFIDGHSSRTQPTGENAYRWKGGETKNRGYVLVYRPDHPRAWKTGYVRRAMLVAEKKIGRPLAPSEVVHHKNQIRDDDREENIDVLPSQSIHVGHHNRSIPRARKLTMAQALEIKALRGTVSYREMGRRYGVSYHSIARICNGVTFKSV